MIDVISIKDFYHPDKDQKESVISVLEQNRKYANYNLGMNFPVIDTKDLFFANLYDQFFLKCQSIFGDFKLSLKNSRTCHCYLDRKRYYLPSVYHNHISTSTINGVYYLDVGEGDSISFWDGEFDNDNMKILDGKEEVHYVSTGELLIFPNHLVHKPNRPTHGEIRYSLNMEIWTDESAEEIFSRDRTI